MLAVGHDNQPLPQQPQPTGQETIRTMLVRGFGKTAIAATPIATCAAIYSGIHNIREGITNISPEQVLLGVCTLNKGLMYPFVAISINNAMHGRNLVADRIERAEIVEVLPRTVGLGILFIAIVIAYGN